MRTLFALARDICTSLEDWWAPLTVNALSRDGPDLALLRPLRRSLRQTVALEV